MLLEPHGNHMADLHLVGLAPDDVGGETDTRVLGERNVGNDVGRVEARQPLMGVDGEGDHRPVA